MLAAACFWPNGGNPECKHCTQFVVIDLASQAVCCFWSCSWGSVLLLFGSRFEPTTTRLPLSGRCVDPCLYYGYRSGHNFGVKKPGETVPEAVLHLWCPVAEIETRNVLGGDQTGHCLELRDDRKRPGCTELRGPCQPTDRVCQRSSGRFAIKPEQVRGSRRVWGGVGYPTYMSQNGPRRAEHCEVSCEVGMSQNALILKTNSGPPRGAARRASESPLAFLCGGGGHYKGLLWPKACVDSEKPA